MASQCGCKDETELPRRDPQWGGQAPQTSELVQETGVVWGANSSPSHLPTLLSRAQVAGLGVGCIGAGFCVRGGLQQLFKWGMRSWLDFVETLQHPVGGNITLLRYIKCVLFSSLTFVLNIISNAPASKPLTFLWFEGKCRRNTPQPTSEQSGTQTRVPEPHGEVTSFYVWRVLPSVGEQGGNSEVRCRGAEQSKVCLCVFPGSVCSWHCPPQPLRVRLLGGACTHGRPSNPAEVGCRPPARWTPALRTHVTTASLCVRADSQLQR